ncbi:right-handed parallel beta-helix repeat-containing protein [Acidihalobacter ferrooxydans]|uniref:right-handed parallel beta-helix repeat-containing protein n=1 Tax=Acidihalobacter ferrooxydans TaxID=1765967 RepID=UPI0018DC36D5|nr:right-handed parallel beta-helix repeat-containing protein [Acidihalobacter ferrooxydans]
MALIFFGLGATLQAATLRVGPDRTYATPGAAARVAKPGDTIKIAPGIYQDCAVWRSNDITIEGTGPGVVLSGKTCQGKAIFVINANHVTVRGITFRNAHVPDGNGAGIRAGGRNLYVVDDQFLDNQEGILAGAIPGGSLVIEHSRFIHNGTCSSKLGCAHGVYVGHIAVLKITDSVFFDTQVGHDIKSRALKTVLIGNRIEDGPHGTASYEVDIPNGGTLIMRDNIIEKGPNSDNHGTAIMLGEAGRWQPTQKILIEGNTFTNNGPPTVFVRNLTPTPARLIGNTLKGNTTTPLTGKGSVQ